MGYLRQNSLRWTPEQALVVASGLSTTSNATVDLIAAKGTSAVDKALTVFKSLGDVPFGFLPII